MNSSTSAQELYTLCLGLAKTSLCQKLGFGAVLIEDDVPMPRAQASNNPIPELAHLCEDHCIRFGIPSRTESMIGACGHAEEQCVWMAMKHGMTEMSKSELYVQGCAKDGFPLVKKRPTFTCIRCATMMQYAGVRGINVWYHDDWLFIDTGLAIYQASQYATGKLEVDSK